MMSDNSSIEDLIIEIIARQGVKRFRDLREGLEALNTAVSPLELRVIVADMVRRGLLGKEVCGKLKSFSFKLVGQSNLRGYPVRNS